MSVLGPLNVTERARQSHGSSLESVRSAVLKIVGSLVREPVMRPVLDVGCGQGELAKLLRGRFARYEGADVLRYADFPSDCVFHQVDLDSGRIPVADGTFVMCICVETIEHVENPRALVRELVRVLEPGGWLVVTTPNQLSFRSKLCLVVRNEFPAFQERPGLYPAHLTALLEIDLVRIARENGLIDVRTSFTGSGRIPFTKRHWPRAVSREAGSLGRLLSDQIVLTARRPFKSP